MASSSSHLAPPSVTSIPLASPMSYDPHTNENGNSSTQFPFASAFSPLSISKNKSVEEGDLFLGLDLSTQALKATFITSNLSTMAEYSLNFDKDLPHYLTTSGVHLGSSEGVVTSPVSMWLEAIDLLLARISSTEAGKGFLSRTKSISGAAQQHATVYWSHQATSLLSSLSPKKTLVEQLKPAFVSLDSPNWQDSSTSKECLEMEAAIAGKEAMSKRTGSSCHERFSGPQIMKIRKQNPELYAATDRISLASSFLTTILIGDLIQSIEESDACGMNLWNLETGQDWDSDLLAIVAGGAGAPVNGLKRKLGPVIKYGGLSSGFISTYLVDRYGFSPQCIISPCTGDNPSTLLSFSLLSSDVVVSLGTSDTILLSTTDYVPNIESHTFSYPANMLEENGIGTGKRSYMGMLCYKNGSLPREYVCEKYANGNWDEFNRLVEKYPLVAGSGKEREIGFYFLKPEIIPHNGTGIHRFNSAGEEIDEFSNPELNPSAILISQFLSFKLRSSPMLASNDGVPNRIFAVGGASTNLTILQLLSNILSAPIHLSSSSSASTSSSSVNSCSLGAALKAYWTHYRRIDGNGNVNFEDCVRIARSQKGGIGEVEKVIMPDLSVREEVERLLVRFRELEGRCCV